MKKNRFLFIIMISLTLLVLILVYIYLNRSNKRSGIQKKDPLQSQAIETATIGLPSQINLQNNTFTDLVIDQASLTSLQLPNLYQKKSLSIDQLSIIVESDHASLGNKVGDPNGDVFFAYSFSNDRNNFTVRIYSSADPLTRQGNLNYAFLAALYRAYYYEADFNDLQLKIKPVYFTHLKENPIIIETEK